jgi:hypothetical protein
LMIFQLNGILKIGLLFWLYAGTIKVLSILKVWWSMNHLQIIAPWLHLIEKLITKGKTMVSTSCKISNRDWSGTAETFLEVYISSCRIPSYSWL